MTTILPNNPQFAFALHNQPGMIYDLALHGYHINIDCNVIQPYQSAQSANLVRSAIAQTNSLMCEL